MWDGGNETVAGGGCGIEEMGLEKGGAWNGGDRMKNMGWRRWGTWDRPLRNG